MPFLLVGKLNFLSHNNCGIFPPLSKFKMFKTGLCPPLLQALPTLCAPMEPGMYSLGELSLSNGVIWLITHLHH